MMKLEAGDKGRLKYDLSLFEDDDRYAVIGVVDGMLKFKKGDTFTVIFAEFDSVTKQFYYEVIFDNDKDYWWIHEDWIEAHSKSSIADYV